MCKQKYMVMVNVLKFRILLFLFSNKMLVFRAGIHKMLVRIASREDPDQTASSEAVLSGSAGLFGRQLVFKILEHLLYKKKENPSNWCSCQQNLPICKPKHLCPNTILSKLEENSKFEENSVRGRKQIRNRL